MRLLRTRITLKLRNNLVFDKAPACNNQVFVRTRIEFFDKYAAGKTSGKYPDACHQPAYPTGKPDSACYKILLRFGIL